MAYLASKLTKLDIPGPVGFWTYWTLEDSVIQVKSRGYFAAAQERLTFGDWIFVTASTGSAILHVDEIDPLELGGPQ